MFRWRASIVEMMLSLETITIEGLRERGGKMGGFVVAHACIFPTPSLTLNIPCLPEIHQKVYGRVVARGYTLEQTCEYSIGSAAAADVVCKWVT